MLNSSKDIIFKKLKRNNQPFPNLHKPEKYLEMVPIDDLDVEKLWLQFARESERLSSRIYLCSDYTSAEKKLSEIIGNEQKVLYWNDENLPIKSLPESKKRLSNEDIRNISEMKIGVTGALAAIAATGSIIINSGEGRSRSASLLPDIHIVLLEKKQIHSTFENWLAFQRQNDMQDLLNPSNVVLISGPSRTADIAMELILGMHGPKELHIIVF